jgi:hypothetical protein
MLKQNELYGTYPSSKTNINSPYLSCLVGIKPGYNLYKNRSLLFSPTLRFALNSINKNARLRSFLIPSDFLSD